MLINYKIIVINIQHKFRLILIFLLCFYVVFFPEVGGSTLDSHHGFVVEYGIDRDVELGGWSLKTFVNSFFVS